VKYFILIILFALPIHSASPLRFRDACAPGNRIVIAAVGDILLHHPLQVKASKYGYESLWQEALPYLQAADLAYGNLEGPIAPGVDGRLRTTHDPMSWDYNVYTTYPLFNYHPTLATALKQSRFGILSNANNHALDRSSIGADTTIDTLDKNGLPHVGTAKSNGTLDPARIVNINGMSIAWIACTEHTNGNADRHNQILHCYREDDKGLILSTIQKLRYQVDAIFVSPHWGDEYHPLQNRTQTSFAHEVLDAGATAVIGAHPHVLEPVEKYTTKDGRETLVAYSLGNFVSNQSKMATRSTMILLLGLTKTSNNTTIVNGVRYVPMLMENVSGIEALHLRQLRKDDHDKEAHKIIASAIDDQRALYALPIVTNVECQDTLSLISGF